VAGGRAATVNRWRGTRMGSGGLRGDYGRAAWFPESRGLGLTQGGSYGALGSVLPRYRPSLAAWTLLFSISPAIGSVGRREGHRGYRVWGSSRRAHSA